MNRGQIARSIAGEFDLHLFQAGQIIDFTLDQISQALVDGRRVYIRGFASFVKKIRSERNYRHPKTGKIIRLPPRPYVDFTAFPALIKSLGAIKKTARRAIRRKPPAI